MLNFNWDARKETANKKKHGVTFEEAVTCFYDPMHILIDDPDHSESDERMILIGLSGQSRLLVVVHAEIVENDIRIISARKATRKERIQYEGV